MVLALGLAALGGQWSDYPAAVQCGALAVALLAGACAALAAAALMGIAGVLTAFSFPRSSVGMPSGRASGSSAAGSQIIAVSFQPSADR